MIAELSNRHSLQAIARELGRDVSWVSRRLSMIKALPEDLQSIVRNACKVVNQDMLAEYTARNPENLKLAKVGDAVVVTLTEAFAMSLSAKAVAGMIDVHTSALDLNRFCARRREVPTATT